MTVTVVERESPLAPAAASGLILGEVRTGLLRSSGPLTSDALAEFLALLPHRVVRFWERPVRHAASPEVLTGVDCLVPSAVGRGVRGVGTVVTDARVTGGQIVQVTTRTQVTQAGENRRQPWSHYLTEPGRFEVWGPVRTDDVVDGFLEADPAEDVLDLGGPAAHRLDTLQVSRLLDGAHTYRPERIRLRWAAVGGSRPAAHFALADHRVRTLRLELPPELLAVVAALAQDIALHDWLLTSVVALIDRATATSRDRASVVRTLAPAFDHLLHAWMPAARLGDDLQRYWAEIDRRSGLSRQWQASVQRIRDQIALATVETAISRPESGNPRER